MTTMSTEFLALKQPTIKVLHRTTGSERHAKSIRWQLEQGRDETAADQSIQHILSRMPRSERRRIQGTQRALKEEIRTYRRNR